MKKLIALLASLLLSHAALAAVNINTATAAELDAINGIGPVKAKAIIDYRAKSGPFKTVDDLKKVTGFGDKTVEKLRKDIVVSGVSSRPVQTIVLPKSKP